MDVYSSNHLVKSSLGSPPYVRKREAVPNLKKGENKRVSKIMCLVKEKINVNLPVLSDERVKNH